MVSRMNSYNWSTWISSSNKTSSMEVFSISIRLLLHGCCIFAMSPDLLLHCKTSTNIIHFIHQLRNIRISLLDIDVVRSSVTHMLDYLLARLPPNTRLSLLFAWTRSPPASTDRKIRSTKFWPRYMPSNTQETNIIDYLTNGDK